MIKIAINGFGTIGRNIFKIAFERHDLEIVAINDPTDAITLAHLLQYDSSYGVYNRTVSAKDDFLIIGNKKIQLFSTNNAADLPWQDLNIDIVIDTDPTTTLNQAQKHLDVGAQKIILTSQSQNNAIDTIILGVNEDSIDPSARIISCASSTANCAAPILKLLETNFGVEKATLTSIHSHMLHQPTITSPSNSLRTSRSTSESIIPITTYDSQSIAQAIPSLSGKLTSCSFYVPTPVVSLVDITAIVKKDTTIAEVNNLFLSSAKEPFYEGLLDVSDNSLISSDFRGDAHSCIVDLPLTNVIGDNLIKLTAWYDNEWGYSNRLVELAADFSKGA